MKSSVLDTFKPSNIFSRIGVSKKYAGAALFEKVKEVCQKEVEEITKQQGQGEESVMQSKVIVCHKTQNVFFQQKKFYLSFFVFFIYLFNKLFLVPANAP